MARRKDMTVRDEDTAKTPTIYVALDLLRRRWTVGVLLSGDWAARLFQIARGDRESSGCDMRSASAAANSEDQPAGRVGIPARGIALAVVLSPSLCRSSSR